MFDVGAAAHCDFVSVEQSFGSEVNNTAIYCSPTEGSQFQFAPFFCCCFCRLKRLAAFPHLGFYFFYESHLNLQLFHAEDFCWITGLCLTSHISVQCRSSKTSYLTGTNTFSYYLISMHFSSPHICRLVFATFVMKPSI